MVEVDIRHWAVLIGINFYVEDRCLQGCVRDAETVKQYLEAGSKSVDIVLLSATMPLHKRSRHPIEEPEFWPTSRNVVSSLKRVLLRAQAGDFVYIHYSGHGTQTPNPAQLERNNSGELALVLFEDNEIGSSYLRGRHLANALRKMVEKGLLVTLVLDCCFSGSIVRHDNEHGCDTRSVDYKSYVDAQYLAGNESEFIGSPGNVRDSQVESDWLISPHGYTILSACGPYEKAWELEIEGLRRGALTYFLIDALSVLKGKGVELTHQSLYQCMRTKFHVSWPQQTPMAFGNNCLSFFSKLSVMPDIAFISLHRTSDGRLCLDAGQAHGVQKGDEYAIYPFDWSESDPDKSNKVCGTFRVDEVRCLTSDLLEVEPGTAINQTTIGWKAKRITHFSPWKMYVRLTGIIDNQELWLKAAEANPFLRFVAENEKKQPCIFNVTVNERNEYEILNCSYKKTPSLPNIALDIDGASRRVINILQHIATFKYFEGLENRTPNALFESSFSLLPDLVAGAPGSLRVKDSEKWGFTVENSGLNPLYLAIFNFTPSWQISNLVSDSGGGEFLVVPPREGEAKGKKRLRLQMKVPQAIRLRGENQCEDIVKIFITNRPTSFPSMILPDISIHITDLETPVRGSGDQLSTVISDLTRGFCDQGDDLVHERWATRNFIIITVAE